MSTTYMNLDLPVVSVTTGPEYAEANNTAFETIDAHDHTPGKGTPVPSAGIDVDDDLDFQSNKAIDVGAVNLVAQASTLDATNVQSVYSYNGDAYFNNGSGVPVQLTSGSSIATPSSTNTPAGIVLPYAGSSAPTGYLLCNGSAISRTTYATLFAVIGTSFGVGDGSTTFNLPNANGRVPVGAGNYTDPVSGSVTRTLGASAGAEKHVLVTAEMPAHNHGGGAHTHNMFVDTSANTGTLSGATQGVGRALSVGSAVDYTLQGSGSTATLGQTSSSGTINSTQGSDTAHNIMQPYFVINYIIKT